MASVFGPFVNVAVVESLIYVIVFFLIMLRGKDKLPYFTQASDKVRGKSFQQIAAIALLFLTNVFNHIGTTQVEELEKIESPIYQTALVSFLERENNNEKQVVRLNVVQGVECKAPSRGALVIILLAVVYTAFMSYMAVTTLMSAFVDFEFSMFIIASLCGTEYLMFSWLTLCDVVSVILDDYCGGIKVTTDSGYTITLTGGKFFPKCFGVHVNAKKKKFPTCEV